MLIASPPAPDIGTGAASAKPLLQAPHNVCLDEPLSHSLVGTCVLSLSSCGRRSPFAIAEDVSDAVLFFAAAQGHLPEILVVENGGPCLVEPSKAPSTTVAPETFNITVKTKLVLEVPKR